MLRNTVTVILLNFALSRSCYRFNGFKNKSRKQNAGKITENIKQINALNNIINGILYLFCCVFFAARVAPATVYI